MSNTEYKFCLRAHLPHLNGKSMTEAYQYFKGILGEANDLDQYDDGDDDGEVDYFRYDGKFQPRQEYSYKRGAKNDRWCVDLVLSHTDDYDGSLEVYTTIQDLQKHIQEMVDKFGVHPGDVLICAYDWYNGSDEPVTLEKNI